jgi:hypothetical protein
LAKGEKLGIITTGWFGRNLKSVAKFNPEVNFVDEFMDKINFSWIQTSYNTKGGKHYSSEDPNILSNTPEKAFRKNFARPGYIYDQQRDAFMEPQPFSSWTLNEETCMWEPPVPYIYDGKAYVWNEETKTFDLRS